MPCSRPHSEPRLSLPQNDGVVVATFRDRIAVCNSPVLPGDGVPGPWQVLLVTCAQFLGSQSTQNPRLRVCLRKDSDKDTSQCEERGVLPFTVCD